MGAWTTDCLRKVMQRVGRPTILLPAQKIRDGLADEALCFFGRSLECELFGQSGGDGGRVGAACAVCGDPRNERRAEFRHFAVGEEQIGRNRSAKVTAFQKKGGAEE